MHGYFTRTSKQFHIPKIRTNIKKFSICFKGPKIFNSLPTDILFLCFFILLHVYSSQHYNICFSKKNNRMQYITRKEKIKKYYSTVCTYELKTVGVLIQ